MTDMWITNVDMTPQRLAVYEAMERYDEGLGPRAFRVLLQVGDSDPRLRPSDAADLWDDPQGLPLLAWRGIDTGYTLAPFGRQLYDAANAGDFLTVIRLTTDATFGRELN